jgi:hypothetical protein
MASDLGNPFVASGIRLLDYLIIYREAIEFLKNGVASGIAALGLCILFAKSILSMVLFDFLSHLGTFCG